jgi:hypothetical protein
VRLGCELASAQVDLDRSVHVVQVPAKSDREPVVLETTVRVLRELRPNPDATVRRPRPVANRKAP